MTASDTNTNESGWLGSLRAPQAAPPWTLLDAGLNFGVLALAMIVIAPTVALLVTDATPASITGGLIIGWTIGLAVSALYAWLTRRRLPESRAALAIVRGTIPLPLVLLMGVAAGLTVDLIAAWGSGGQFLSVAELRGISGQAPEWVMAGLLLVIVQPVAHGLIFFGVLLPRLRASFGPWPGLLLTVAVFVIYHLTIYGERLPADSQLWYGIIVPGVNALFLAALRLRTGSTLATIIAHVGIGLIAILTALALA